MFNTFFKRYVLFFSILMISQFLFITITDALSINVESLLNNRVFASIMQILLFFGYVNIIIVGVGSLFLLFDRKSIGYGILGLIATATYLYYIIQIGNGF